MPRMVHVNLDKPIEILGVDPEDVGVMVCVCWLLYMLVRLFFSSLFGLPVAVLVGIVLTWVIGRVKRRQAPGYILHVVWSWGIPFPGLGKWLKPGTRLKV